MATRPPDGPSPRKGRPPVNESAPGITFSVDAEGIVRTTMRGTITAADLAAHVRARASAQLLTSPQLIDARDAQLDLTTEDVRSLAALVGQLRSTGGTARTAFVAQQDFAYGMARMYAALGVRYDPGFAVFRSLDEAESWLRE